MDESTAIKDCPSGCPNLNEDFVTPVSTPCVETPNVEDLEFTSQKVPEPPPHPPRMDTSPVEDREIASQEVPEPPVLEQTISASIPTAPLQLNFRQTTPEVIGQSDLSNKENPTLTSAAENTTEETISASAAAAPLQTKSRQTTPEVIGESDFNIEKDPIATNSAEDATEEAQDCSSTNHEKVVVAQSPPVDINTTLPTANKEQEVKEDQNKIDDSNPSKSSNRGRGRRIHYAKYNERELPDTKADLTDEQICSLFLRPPEVRKRYTKYFSKGCGYIVSSSMRLLFQRDASGKLRFSEDILRSNIGSWEKKLRGYEYPDQYLRTGEPRPHGDAEENLTRKRKRPLVEDSTAESSSQPALKTIRGHTPALESPFVGPTVNPPKTSASSNSVFFSPQQLTATSPTPLGNPTQQPSTEPPANYLFRPNIRVIPPLTPALVEILLRLEVGHNALLTKEDIMQIIHWIGDSSLMLQGIVSRSLLTNMPTEPRYILFDLQDDLSRASRVCTAFSHAVQHEIRESEDHLEKE
ncbi:hypothetical protein PENSTE_c005G02176 [Penicillium steckii]|uniref:Uncharacterized protein n=1 Tax=Penicillium steckii TaxID=303698 RepID=A0A1V6TJ32_9EURO|nr:hypothetical protein PENSTE_c005G02176 [Penicillium steckii]